MSLLRPAILGISIHAPHMGRDAYISGVSKTTADFNPRAPYGARPTSDGYLCNVADFNPRAPYGARQKISQAVQPDREFQSTRPIWGATRMARPPVEPRTHFNPRAPYGARLTMIFTFYQTNYNFNPRAPYGARQQKCIKCIIYVLHFCNNRQPKHKSQQETSSVRTFF